MIACTLGLLATGIYGITQLDIDFSLSKYFDIKEGSYQDKFLEAEKLFEKQEKAAILLGNFNYSSEVDKLHTLVKELDALDSVEVSLKEPWLSSLSSPANFSDFLASPSGRAFASFFNISEETKQIRASMIPFKFITPHTTSKGMALADEIDALVEAQVPIFILLVAFHTCYHYQEFEGRVFVWLNPLDLASAHGTLFYKMMGLIVNDMFISIGLTLLAILVISLLMTVNVTISLLSLAAVAATVVDTAGIAHFWGLVVEPFFAVIFKNQLHI